MTHMQYGKLVDTGVPRNTDAGTAGVADLTDAIILLANNTMAMLGDGNPMFGLELQGRINKSEDTVHAVFVMSWVDAGALIGDILKASNRGGHDAIKEVERGIDISMESGRG